MHALWHDIRFGGRILANQPGLTSIAVLTLALGIGANAGIFSVLRQVLLQRLPVPSPERVRSGVSSGSARYAGRPFGGASLRMNFLLSAV